jgi:hypothetical protein
MAQILYVKNKDGQVGTVKVLRAWIDINGQEVFLHADGRYARKDGQPLKSVADFNVIADVLQREQALRWWKRAGEAESIAYFTGIEEKRRDEAGDFRLLENDLTTVDAILYTRRGNGKKKGAAISAPKSWMEWFEKRPDWWGQAKKIEFMDYVYEIAEDVASEARAPNAEEAKAEQASAAN